MSIVVRGVTVKLMDSSMIRRYGTLTPIVDPAVAKILINKGLAIYTDNKIEEKKQEEVMPIDDFSENTLFPKEVISEV